MFIRKIMIRPLLCLAFGLLMISCGEDADLSVDVPPPPELDSNTVWDARIKELYERYGIWFRYDVPQKEVLYNLYGDVISGLAYTEVDKQRIPEFLDLLTDLLFDRLPEPFLKEHLPMNVLLFDEFRTSERMLDGYITANATMFAKIGGQMDEADPDELHNGWISLLFEKMLAGWEYPTAFAEISKEGYEQFIFWDDEDITEEYALLRRDRTGLAEELFTVTSVAQDFGDYVAFTLNFTPAQKEAYYRKNAGVKQKEELIQQYFHKQFGFRLPIKTEPR